MDLDHKSIACVEGDERGGEKGEKREDLYLHPILVFQPATQTIESTSLKDGLSKVFKLNGGLLIKCN